MTKQQEIDIIDRTIATLGHESYLGPWLSAHREQIVSDIRQDIEPAPTPPAECYRHAAAVVAEATQHAAEIVTDARERALRLQTETRQQIEQQRRAARTAVERIAQQIA